MGRHLPKWGSVTAFPYPSVPPATRSRPKGSRSRRLPAGLDNAGAVPQSHLIFFSCHVSQTLSLWKTLLLEEDLSLAFMVPLLCAKWL